MNLDRRGVGIRDAELAGDQELARFLRPGPAGGPAVRRPRQGVARPAPGPRAIPEPAGNRDLRDRPPRGPSAAPAPLLQTRKAARRCCAPGTTWRAAAQTR